MEKFLIAFLLLAVMGVCAAFFAGGRISVLDDCNAYGMAKISGETFIVCHKKDAP